LLDKAQPKSKLQQQHGLGNLVLRGRIGNMPLMMEGPCGGCSGGSCSTCKGGSNNTSRQPIDLSAVNLDSLFAKAGMDVKGVESAIPIAVAGKNSMPNQVFLHGQPLVPAKQEPLAQKSASLPVVAIWHLEKDEERVKGRKPDVEGSWGQGVAVPSETSPSGGSIAQAYPGPDNARAGHIPNQQKQELDAVFSLFFGKAGKDSIVAALEATDSTIAAAGKKNAQHAAGKLDEGGVLVKHGGKSNAGNEEEGKKRGGDAEGTGKGVAKGSHARQKAGEDSTESGQEARLKNKHGNGGGHGSHDGKGIGPKGLPPDGKQGMKKSGAAKPKELDLDKIEEGLNSLLLASSKSRSSGKKPVKSKSRARLALLYGKLQAVLARPGRIPPAKRRRLEKLLELCFLLAFSD